MHFIKYMSSAGGGVSPPWDDALWMYDFNGLQSPEGGINSTPIYTPRQIGTYPGVFRLAHRGYSTDGEGPHELISDEDDYYAETGGDVGDGRSFCYDLQRSYDANADYYHGELEFGAWTGQETYTFGAKLKWDSSQQGIGAYWLFASGSATTYGTQIYKDGNDYIGFRMIDTLGAWQTCLSTSAIAFDTSIMIACQYDAGTGEMSIWYSVTGSGVIAKIGSHTVTQAIANPPASHGYSPHIGARNSGTYGTALMEGQLDQFWSFGTILTEPEMLALADGWDMSASYQELTGYEWYPGGLPPVIHMDCSWYGALHTKSGFGQPQVGNTGAAGSGWTITNGDEIKTIWCRSGNKVTIVTNDGTGGIPPNNPWSGQPIVRTDANSGLRYLEFYENRVQYSNPTWRVFTRKAQVEGKENVDFDNRTYIVVAKTRTGGGGTGGCVYTTFNREFNVGTNVAHELHLEDGTFKFQEVVLGTGSATTVATTTDGLESTFKIFVVTVDNKAVKLYVDNTTAADSKTFTGTAAQGNDTLTPLFFCDTWDYNYSTTSTNEYNEDLGELAIYDRALSEAELTAVVADLKAKWNIT